jgi:putative ABC transport system permease protein
MKTIDIFSLSVKGLNQSRFRSILSAVGIIFGVASVISMLSVGEGAKQEIIDQLRFLGTNNISVNSIRSNSDEGLSLYDSDRIQAALAEFVSVSPVRTVMGEVSYGGIDSICRTMSILPEYFEINGLSLEKGRFFDAADCRDKNMVCVIGAGVKRELFAHREPLGECLFFNGHCYSVVGHLKNINIPKSSVEAIKTHDVNRDIYIPITSAMSGNKDIDTISIRVSAEDKVMAAAGVVKSVLERTHGGTVSYEILIPRELLKQSFETRKTFSIVLVLISGITLLTGGIGIANTMLLNITKRTKEIGIRRALGATKNEILLQFLIESVLLTIAGGLIGIAAGYLSSALIGHYTQWHIIVPTKAVFLAFIISVGVGILSGLYPAFKASELDPETTLRFE